MTVHNPQCKLRIDAFSEQMNSKKTASTFPPSWGLVQCPPCATVHGSLLRAEEMGISAGLYPL